MYKNSITVPEMLTVHETTARTGLSEWYIRSLIREKKIVFVKCGNRYLINLQKLVDYLNGETLAEEASSDGE